MAIGYQYWFAIIIFLISFATHLALISKGPVTIDCLNLVINAQATLQTHHLQYQFGTGYPLMVLLGATFMTVAQWMGITDPVLAVNFIGVLFGSITVLIFYLLLQDLCDSLTALLASLILLLNPIFLDVSSYGINHAPALCFLLLGIFALLRFQRSQQRGDLFLSALYLGLMGATRLQDLLLTLPAIIAMFILGLKPRSLPIQTPPMRHFLLYGTTIFIIIALFHLPYFVFNHGDYSAQAHNFWQIGLTQNFQGPISKFLIKSMSYVLQAFSLVGIFCFCAGFLGMAAVNKRLFVFTWLWCFIPFIFYGNTMTSAPRFYTILLPAIIIPISIFLARVMRNKKLFWKVVALTAFLCIILQPLSKTEETFLRRHHYSLLADYYLWVNKITEPNATIISCDDNLFIEYYSKRHTLVKPALVHRHLPPQDLITFKRKLDDLLDNHQPVYITTLVLDDYDDFLEFRNLMLQNYRLIPQGDMPLEFWYETPFKSFIDIYGLVKVEKKTKSLSSFSKWVPFQGKNSPLNIPSYKRPYAQNT